MALYGMFDGVCSVWSIVQEADADGIQRGREVLAAADVPCHLVLTSAGVARNEGKGSRISAVGKVFLPPELVVKPGSMVRVYQQGQEYRLVCSSVARVYCWHQEIELCRPEDWA